MKALTIAGVALLRLVRDRSNIFFVFILPIGIILIIGALFGGGFVAKLGVVVEEGAGPLGEELAIALEAREDIEVLRVDSADDLLRSVERGDLQAGAVVPAGYDGALRTGEDVTVGFVARPDAAVFQAVVGAAVSEQAGVVRAARFAAEETGASFEETIVVAGSAAGALAGVDVEMRSVGESVFPTTLGQFDLGASSQLVLFMFLTGLTGSAAIIETRRLGVASRMLSTPTSAGVVVGGEGMGRFAVVMLQGLYILFATLLLFQVNWGDPLGAAAIMIAFGAVCAGTAMLMGTLFRNDEQASGVGVMVGLGVAALGGCMIPIELYSDTMQRVAHLTPHAWALDAFAELVREDGTLVDILPELAVLAGFAAVLITIAALRLRRAIATF